MPAVAGIILAGGRSQRMGRDKALLSLPGNDHVTFVEHLASLLASLCSEVILVARDAQQASLYTLPNAYIVTDQAPDVGPLMGLYSGLQAVRAEHALLVAVDMPFVQSALLAFLLSFVCDDALVVPVVEGVPQVLLAVYPRSLLPTIERYLSTGARGPRALLNTANVCYVEEALLRRVDPQLHSFVNLNTPSDVALYKHQQPLP